MIKIRRHYTCFHLSIGELVQSKVFIVELGVQLREETSRHRYVIPDITRYSD